MSNILLSRSNAYRLLLLLPLLALAGLCVFYLANGYDALAAWYESLPGPFYRKAYWREELFTRQTREAGRLFCLLALLLIPALGVAVFKGKIPPRNPIARADALHIALIAGVALLLGIFNALVAQISMDEDQSALFFGSTHPFRALSHYPVPNNHILYNTLNALFATPETALISGKIIAILAYAGFGLIVYRWFMEVGVRRRAATALALLSLLPFPVWGFSGQARSYPLYLLAGWWALLLATRFFKTGDGRQLYFYPVAVAAGYGMLPTFVYFHAGLCVWGLWLALSRKNLYFPFWRAQAFAVAASFLVLLPLLAFSGLKSIAGHQWVTTMPWSDFYFPPFGPFRDYLTGYGRLGYLLGIFTALFSLGLLLFKNTRWLGALFCALWIGGDLIVVLMRQTCFTRQLVGLYSASLAVALVAAYLLLQKLSGKYRPKLVWGAAMLVSIGLAFGVLKANYERLNDALYIYDIRKMNKDIREMLLRVPEGATVGFTDKVFLPQAVWERSGKTAVPVGQAAYRMQMKEENLVSPGDSLAASYLNFRLYRQRR